MSIWKRKSIDLLLAEASDSEKGLKRTLSSGALVALGIGAIIGAGLFSLTGIAAAENAGPAVTLSFVLAAIGCAFAGLCYAEFASMIPVAGSAYTYSYATMGEFMAWIIGWDLVLEYALGAATVGVSWSRYFLELLNKFGIHLPHSLICSPWETLKLSDGTVIEGGVINLPAVLVVSLLSLLLIRGTKESANLNNFLVILKVAVVILFIILGWNYINPDNYSPYIPENTGVKGQFGWSGIAAGAATVFFAFIGFDAVSTAAQEAKNPQKGMPIGILGSLIVCTILYVLFAHVMTGLVPYHEFAGDAKPAATAFSKTPYTFLQTGLIVAVLAGYTSVMLVMLMGQSRVFYTMSNDGLLPKFFSTIHPKYRTPWKTNIFFLLFVSVFAGFVPVSDLGHMVSIGTLLAFVLVCIGVLVMRVKMPDIPRAFKTPLVPFVPIAGILVCLYLMYSLPLESWMRLVIWMALGIIIYFIYGKKNSKLNKDKE
ncbi:amino acid permease [Flavobacterium columnare]|uniref:Amino acid-transporting permease n=1 Tax=Flavobacterium columnare (strain ATCC 49512 / CIP 103533 / TG 44/87) TaxID=1041826 RepID=G8XAF2_FLACA|nr:amino acid permease [Flavobacterium columnare]AEW86623.1 putative amino acid-transporting permease [Flavobacterium columnare ATCC 49512]ANO47030.1 putative amino acid-transporting permease [Flavobacterium columnare]APT22272.1 amino acid transporter [Flavobacterium columnare]AUX18492.1 amino acid transporter [Flavobacterium columnare]MEB3801468.1 amino acid permease [Flavobacterium columnare]